MFIRSNINRKFIKIVAQLPGAPIINIKIVVAQLPAQSLLGNRLINITTAGMVCNSGKLHQVGPVEENPEGQFDYGVLSVLRIPPPYPPIPSSLSGTG